jgi:hypothetical protein
MTGRGMALVAAARRALLAQTNVPSVRIVRDAAKLDVPLAQQTAHLLQPVATERATWPESPDWQYERAVFTLTTLARGRPGTEIQARLAEAHETALEALCSDEDILAVVSDGPPSRRADIGPGIAGVRWGDCRAGSGRPGDPLTMTTAVCLSVATAEPAESATLDAAALFAGGPHEIVPDSPRRGQADRVFNGLAGALMVDLGSRPRRILQRGRLSAAGRESLAQLEAAIESRIDGHVHALIARDGTTYPHVRVERFTRGGPVEVGLRYHRAYEIEYTEFSGGN